MQDTLHRTDQFKNEKLRECIRKAFFCGDKSELVRYKDKFNPIPLPSIALVCVLVCHSPIDLHCDLLIPHAHVPDRALYSGVVDRGTEEGAP